MPTVGSRQLADRSVSRCYREKTDASFRTLKAMDVFYLQNFLPVTQATRSASICTLQTAWSRLFPVATLKSSLKATQEFWVPAVSLAGSGGPSRTHSFSCFHGERHSCFLGVWEKGRSTDFSILQVFWWLPWLGGSWCSGQKCPSPDITAMEFGRT